MRDEDHRHVKLFTKRLDGVKHLRLNGDVQRCGWLVCQQDFRVENQRDGDDDALFHAAGELVRVIICTFAADADGLQHFQRLFPSLLLADFLMRHDRLGNLVANCRDGVKASHGVLEDHGDLFAADGLPMLFLHRQKVFPAIENLTADNLARWTLDQTHDAARQRCFACAGLADETQRFALAKRQRQTIERVDASAVGVILNDKVFYFQNVAHSRPPSSSYADRAHHAGRRR